MTLTATSRFEAAILAAFVRLPGVLPAVYRPKAGGEVATSALLEDRRMSTGRTARTESAVIRLPRAAVAAPAVGDVVEVDGETWTHRQEPDADVVHRVDGPFWLLFCRLDPAPIPGGGK